MVYDGCFVEYSVVFLRIKCVAGGDSQEVFEELCPPCLVQW